MEAVLRAWQVCMKTEKRRKESTARFHTQESLPPPPASIGTVWVSRARPQRGLKVTPPASPSPSQTETSSRQCNPSCSPQSKTERNGKFFYPPPMLPPDPGSPSLPCFPNTLPRPQINCERDNPKVKQNGFRAGKQ